MLPAAVAAEEAQPALSVPSGQLVTLSEVLLDQTPGETWARFRFVAPAIARDGGSLGHEAAAPDMDHLCRTLALPYLQAEGLTAARVVISLADRELPFGSRNSAATQFFETYRPNGADCVWEGL